MEPSVMTSHLTEHPPHIDPLNKPSYFSTAFKDTLSDIVASFVGSAACVYTGQPFDTVKVRLQVKSTEYQGMIDCFGRTIKQEGVFALWRGSMPAFLGALSENAMAFATNGILKRLTPQETYKDSLVMPFVTGGITGSFSAMALCPCDVLKCRAQVNIAKGIQSQSMKQMLIELIQQKGFIRGIYTGFSAQLLRDIPFYSSFFGSYDILCRYFKQHSTLSDTTIYFISGGIAGQIGWIVSIAPDSIKSRMQTSIQPTNILETYREIVKTRGIRGLFVGIEVAIVRAFPANAALFLAYELSRESFYNLL